MRLAHLPTVAPRLAPVCLAALLACDGPAMLAEPVDAGPLEFDASPVRTDSLVYHLQAAPGVYHAYATATYTNRTGAPVHFARCDPSSTGPMYWIRRSGADSTARAFIGGGWECVGGVPTGVVPPGGTLTARVWLGSSESPYAWPPILPAERVGRFRLEFELCREATADSDACRPVPQELRQSNAFEVRFDGA